MPRLTTVFGLLLAASVLDCSPLPADEKWITDDLSQVMFTLYTREIGDGSIKTHPQEINFNLTNLADTDFKASRKTVLIMHGFRSDEFFAEKFTKELLIHGDYNVIGIVWHPLATFDNYFKAANNAGRVGKYAGEFLAALMHETGQTHDEVYVLGHSLGAHGAGQVGRTLGQLTGKLLPRVTGLDPAKPYFDDEDHFSERIGKDSAHFVDIIHTNSGPLLDGCLSLPEPLGHVDFFPSGGHHMPGCNEICFFGCIGIDIIDVFNSACSHERANQFMIESINHPEAFKSVLCNSYDEYKDGNCVEDSLVNMGFHLPQSVPEGSYYLEVNKEAPFSQ